MYRHNKATFYVLFLERIPAYMLDSTCLFATSLYAGNSAGTKMGGDMMSGQRDVWRAEGAGTECDLKRRRGEQGSSA